MRIIFSFMFFNLLSNLYAFTYEFASVQFAGGDDVIIKRNYIKKGKEIVENEIPEEINEVKFKDYIYVGDEIVTGKSFLKLRFSRSAFLIIYPGTSISILENDHLKARLSSLLLLKSGTIRIINKEDSELTVLPNVVSSEITFSKIQGEILFKKENDNLKVFNLKDSKSYTSPNMYFGKLIFESRFLEFDGLNEVKNRSLAKSVVEEINIKFRPPSESYFAPEKRAKKTEIKFPKHNLLLGINLGHAILHENADYSSSRHSPYGGGLIRYMYSLSSDSRVGVIVYGGNLDESENSEENKRREIHGVDGIYSKKFYDYFWGSASFGFAEFVFESFTDENVSRIVYGGFHAMFMIEKSWNLFWRVNAGFLSGLELIYCPNINEEDNYDSSGKKFFSAEKFTFGIYLETFF